MPLFRDQTEDAVKAAVERAKQDDRDALADTFNTAVAYLERRMVDDIRSELQQRFPNAQGGGHGQQIQPVVLPMVERFIEESATLYSGKVTRELVNDAGDVDEDATKKLNDALSNISFDETMSAVEQRGILLESCGLLFQNDLDGNLDPTIVLPQEILPVERVTEAGIGGNPSNPASYQGHVVTLLNDTTSDVRAKKTMFAYYDREEITIYEGNTASQMTAPTMSMPNPYAPHMPLVIWHPRKPSELIPTNDVPVLVSNREINILWSVLFHLFRFQAGSTMVRTKLAKTETEPNQPHGPMFPLILGADETASYASPGVPWEGLVDFLQRHVGVVAMLLSMAPADFDLEGQTVASGFAKVIDSLPKIESRKKRAKWAATQERRNWPLLRLALAAQVNAVVIPDGLNLVTTFDELEIPKSIDEQIRGYEFDLEHGLTTPAKILASRRHITIEEAEATIEDNQRIIQPTTLAGIIARSGPSSASAQSADVEPLPPAAPPPAAGGGPGEIVPAKEGIEPAPKTSATPETVFNGAQIASLVDIVKEVTIGAMPFDSAVEIIRVAFNLDEDDARKILDPTKTFEPKQEQSNGNDQPPTRRDRPEGSAGRGSEDDGEGDDQESSMGGNGEGEGQGRT